MEREQKEGKDGKRGWGGRLGMGGDLMGRKGCFGELKGNSLGREWVFFRWEGVFFWREG